MEEGGTRDGEGDMMRGALGRQPAGRRGWQRGHRRERGRRRGSDDSGAGGNRSAVLRKFIEKMKSHGNKGRGYGYGRAHGRKADMR